MTDTESLVETASQFSEAPSSVFSHGYTCLSCQVAFQTAQMQKDHFHSDWHRYNLKRKVVGLGPVTVDVFADKIKESQVVPQEEKSLECTLCNKTYSSENSFKSHLSSKRHKQLSLKKQPIRNEAQQQPMTIEAQQQEEQEEKTARTNFRVLMANAKTPEELEAIIERKISESPRLAETDCIFCTCSSATFEDNMQHMIEAHSFFIPDIEYLADVRGLFRYLADKVSVGNVCLSCNGRGRTLHSLEAVRKHMIDRGHCQIQWDEEIDQEIAEFYNFPVEEEEEDEEWEDLEGDEMEDMEESSIVLVSHQEKKQKRKDAVIIDDELVLPSGKVAGHRQFNRIWRQTLRPDETRESVLINRMMGQYKALGWHTGGQDAQFKKKQAIMSSRAKSDYQTRIGMKANGLQRFFRLQNPM